MSKLFDSIIGFPATHVQREYNWQLTLPSLGLIVDGLVVGKYCQSINFGQYNISEIIEYCSGAHTQFFPGNITIDTITATFVSPIPDMVQLYFVTWKKRIVDSRGFYSPSNNYKKNVYVVLFDRTGLPSNMIQLKGVFPTKFPVFSLSYESANVLKYTVEFKVDTIHMGVKAAGGAFVGVLGGASQIGGVIRNVVESVF